MPLRKKKTSQCLNCGLALEPEYNYCPHCGQENHQYIRSVNHIVADFINDIFQVDGRLFRSIIPFLFQPGKLTKDYIEGKRTKYVSPIRLYLTFSFLYFFLLSFQIPVTKKTITAQINLSDEIDNQAQNIIDTLPQKKKKGNLTIFDINIQRALILKKKYNISEDQILDSLKVSKTIINKIVLQQGIKIGNSTQSEVIKSLLDKVPILMFLLMPMFAGMLKLVYIRRKRFFIEHLVLTLHLHSFLYFILSLGFILAYISKKSEITVSNDVLNILAFWFLIYIIVSFFKVYKQGFFKTFIKLFFLFLMYVILLSLFLLLTLIVGILLF
jgi:Protein of unknown function (DUF3667)